MVGVTPGTATEVRGVLMAVAAIAAVSAEEASKLVRARGILPAPPVGRDACPAVRRLSGALQGPVRRLACRVST